MRVHYIKHVPFEGLGSMEDSFKARGAKLTLTEMYDNQEALPSLESFDWLVVMGGPMGVHDTSEFPWLEVEKDFVASAINAGKVVIGVCLGAQMIAHALNAEVRTNPHKEIGWFNIRREEGSGSALIESLPREFQAFHWHGQTFDLPAGAAPLGSSEACLNQGFVIEDKVVAFQFHLETTEASAQALVDNCASDMDGTRYVQSAEEIMSDRGRFDEINLVMGSVLNKLIKINGND